MAVPFSKKLTTKFVVPEDAGLPQADQSRFILAPLSQDDFDELQLKYAPKPGEDEAAAKVGAMVRLRETVRMSLVGWENYEAEFKVNGDGRPTDDTLKQLSPKNLVAIFNKINEGATLEPADAGKS